MVVSEVPLWVPVWVPKVPVLRFLVQVPGWFSCGFRGSPEARAETTTFAVGDIIAWTYSSIN